MHFLNSKCDKTHFQQVCLSTTLGEMDTLFKTQLLQLTHPFTHYLSTPIGLSVSSTTIYIASLYKLNTTQAIRL